MPNDKILEAVERAWSVESGNGKTILDLSCGGGDTATMLRDLGYKVIATDYVTPPAMGADIHRVSGVDLNCFLPFRDGPFDAVNLVEVIEHIENQPQLIREFARVLKPDGRLLISTPNILNVHSRLRFLFTGFLRGRVRPTHYSAKPGIAPNIYLIHFFELYYLLFHYGFEICGLHKTRIKAAPRIFAAPLYPLMWIFSLEAIIHAEKDPKQRTYNWQILRYFFSAPLLLSDNIVVSARKISDPTDH